MLFKKFRVKRRLKKYLSTKPSQRMVFLPQCLRREGCQATEDPEQGIICQKCQRCDLWSIIALAKNQGTPVFIVPGGSLVEKILQDNQMLLLEHLEI